MRIKNDLQLNTWMSAVTSALQGCAGSMMDNPAARAVAIADDIVLAMVERTTGGAGIEVPRVVPPKMGGA